MEMAARLCSTASCDNCDDDPVDANKASRDDDTTDANKASMDMALGEKSGNDRKPMCNSSASQDDGSHCQGKQPTTTKEGIGLEGRREKQCEAWHNCDNDACAHASEPVRSDSSCGSCDEDSKPEFQHACWEAACDDRSVSEGQAGDCQQLQGLA